MKNHHEVGHFKYRLMIVLLSLAAVVVMAGQSFAATTCSSCHGMPPLDSSDGSRNPGTGAFKGSHQTHVSAVGDKSECVKCHNSANHTNSHAATDGYQISTASNIFNSPSTAKYSRGTTFPQSSTPPTLGTCRNVSCHFETVTPTWGKKPTDPVATNCNTCHATPRGASGSHAKHEAGMTVAGITYSGLNSCSQCHPNYGFGSYSTVASESKFSHATSAGKHKIAVNSFLVYTGGTVKSWLPSQAKVFTTCRATACHDTGRDGARTIQWGTSKAACTACHAQSPATFSHQKHLTGLTGKFKQNAVCADCHNGYVEGTTVNATDHIDGFVDVFDTAPGNLGYPNNKAKGSAFASCSTSNCHSNGLNATVKIYASAQWGNISTGCNFCHPLANLSPGHTAHVGAAFPTGLAFYSFTSNRSSGTNYQFGCGSCHPNSVTKHLDNFVDVDLAPAAAGGTLKLKNIAGATMNGSKKCSNIYCHSNGYATTFKCVTTLAWTDKFKNYTAVSKGGKDKCAWCHGNSPNTATTAPAPVRIGSNAHSAHAVGIHFDDIFNGVSKKLPISGAAAVNAAHGKDSRSTTINCNICHFATMSTVFANDKNTQCVGCHNGVTAATKNPVSLITDSSKHVNGIVDVSFINQKIATKAQVAGSAYNAYSSNWARRSNSMKFKTYTSSYDTTKLALSAAASPYTTGAGCLNIACHSSIAVKWNDAVSCASCHTRLK